MSKSIGQHPTKIMLLYPKLREISSGVASNFREDIMDDVKSTIEAYSTVIVLGRLFGVKITNEISYDEFFKSCVEKMKLRIEKMDIRKIIKFIDFLEQETDPLEKWEKDILEALYKRKQRANTLI